MSDYETFRNDWIDGGGVETEPNLLFEFCHPKHGVYFVWHNTGLYGIGRGPNPVHCGYVSLAELFKWKGL